MESGSSKDGVAFLSQAPGCRSCMTSPQPKTWSEVGGLLNAIPAYFLCCALCQVAGPGGGKGLSINELTLKTK